MFHYIPVITSYQPCQIHRTCSLPMSCQPKFYKPPLGLYQFQFMLIFSIERAIFYSSFPWIKEFLFFYMYEDAYIHTDHILYIHIYSHTHIQS